MFFHPVVSSYPDTVFVFIHLTKTVITAAAGAIACMFRAAGLRTEKSHMLDPAISATLTGEKDLLEGIFEKEFQDPFYFIFL